MLNSMVNRTIMIQGTASNVGKSLLTTALCRILAQNNIKVAPFKSWNMSSYSSLTDEGKEIGMAQAVQARAALINPIVDMQPLLVKVLSNGLTQIIVKGKVLKKLPYEYGSEEYLKWALRIIEGSLAKLRERYQAVIIEGAGSPVEVNVKEKDLANMKVAKLNRTPVILVTDIDRGGALASLVGTLRLLDPEERTLVKGFIINRFRGDFDLLKPGITFLEDYTGKPVLGVIPYLKDIKLPEEDSFHLEGRTEMNDLAHDGLLEADLARLADIVSANLNLEYIFKLLFAKERSYNNEE